jgi:topoisomerase-4 subunit B
MARAKAAYDESSIRTLDALEHIRLRSGMYIGRLGDGSQAQDGVYVMLKEVVDNAVDEFLMGAGKCIEIRREGDAIEVRDYGRGIPLGKLVDCVSRINTGGKYNDDVFQFSVGLNGVGTKAVNALSARFEVETWRDGRFRRAAFERGRLLADESGVDPGARPGTWIRFEPDPTIFGRFAWNDEFVRQRLRTYAFLNPGLVLDYGGERFHSEGGLADLLAHEMGGEEPLYPLLHARSDRLELALTHTLAYGETLWSFVNGQYTNDGGTHQSAFREAIAKAVSEFAGRSFAGEDVRDGLVGAIAIKLQDPVFDSQTKTKLGSDVRGWLVPAVKERVVRWLHEHKDHAARLLDKVRENERVRKELQAVKKEARERARKVAIRIPKLVDCRVHLDDVKGPRRDESTLFLVEGDSAGGVIVQCRDVETQAVFSLRGKPLNCHGLERDAIYKNEELYNLMRALGIEEGIEGLRYARVVIATDADVDGMHIRNLLLTYFLRYFEELVIKGHLFLLETPLYRVRSRKETRYCYSDGERERALAELRGPEITRFKGLGEISPSEFGRFLGPEMRLQPVSIGAMGEIARCLEFFMGRNTPERRAFLVEHLAMDVVR